MFAPDDYYRIRAEFLTLGGGEPWDRIERAAWAFRQRFLEERRRLRALPETRARENRARRGYYRDWTERLVAVRGCKECGQPFGLSHAQKQRRRDLRYCSRSCAAKARVRRHGVHVPASTPELVTIDGVTRTRRAWAAHFGISLVSVYARVQRGMSLVDAFRSPKAQGSRSGSSTRQPSTPLSPAHEAAISSDIQNENSVSAIRR